MSYQGRSPIKDVVRSVVMGAGMISPALMEACATPSPPTTAPVTNDTPVATTPPVATTAPVATTLPVASTPPVQTTPPVVTAPPTTVVRPRPNPTGSSMPTRGFAGAARARG